LSLFSLSTFLLITPFSSNIILSRYSLVGTPKALQVVPPVIFQYVGQFATVCINNFFPLYYAYKIDRLEPVKETFEKFMALLEYPHFRYSSVPSSRPVHIYSFLMKCTGMSFIIILRNNFVVKICNFLKQCSRGRPYPQMPQTNTPTIHLFTKMYTHLFNAFN
jgi:hypothetical protein